MACWHNFIKHGKEPVGRSGSWRGGSFSSDMVILDLPPVSVWNVRFKLCPKSIKQNSQILCKVKGRQSQLTLGPLKVFILYSWNELDVRGWKDVYIYIYFASGHVFEVIGKRSKSLKNQFWTFLKYTLGIVALSGFQISPALLRLKTTAIPAGHPLEADVPSLPRLGFILQHSWIAKKLYRFLAFPEKHEEPRSSVEQDFFAQCCIFVPYPWTWYISFNVAVSYIYPNYSDLTRPHPKWRCGRGTPPTTGLTSGKSRLVKYYNSTRFEFNQVLIVLFKTQDL